MARWVLPFAAAFAGLLAALLAYDWLVVQPRARATNAALAQARQVSIADADAEADRIAARLDASVARSVAGARSALDAQAADVEQRRLAQEALGRAAMFKTALAEYYMSNGQWPADPQQAGLGPADSYAGGAVARIELGPRGTVVIVLNDAIAGGRIRLVPAANRNGMVDWTCATEGAESLRRHLPACRG